MRQKDSVMHRGFIKAKGHTQRVSLPKGSQELGLYLRLARRNPLGCGSGQSGCGVGQAAPSQWEREILFLFGIFQNCLGGGCHTDREGRDEYLSLANLPQTRFLGSILALQSQDPQTPLCSCNDHLKYRSGPVTSLPKVFQCVPVTQNKPKGFHTSWLYTLFCLASSRNLISYPLAPHSHWLCSGLLTTFCYSSGMFFLHTAPSDTL